MIHLQLLKTTLDMTCLQREAPSTRQDLNIVAFVSQTIELRVLTFFFAFFRPIFTPGCEPELQNLSKYSTEQDQNQRQPRRRQ